MTTSNVTFGSASSGVRVGDHVMIGPLRAVVSEVQPNGTITVRWRNAWYWRALWFLMDDWQRTKAHVRSLWRRMR